MSVAFPKIIIYDGTQGRISTQQESEPHIEEDAPFRCRQGVTDVEGASHGACVCAWAFGVPKAPLNFLSLTGRARHWPQAQAGEVSGEVQSMNEREEAQ